ncbi:MAG TPA: class I SAM-dependent methyltransferase [bacterium]|nr:class I SAM-dependent methyltransferase [bacterium]
MNDLRKVDSKEAGLLFFLILGKYFLKTEDLHYGLWTEGMEVNAANFPIAQENHSRFIISRIPQGASTILDVGCGAGVLASKLLDKGYKVDCVSPSPLLTKQAQARLNGGCEIIEQCYEDIEPRKTYDLVMFSESFQYVKLAAALPKTMKLLNAGGHLLICDFFKTEAKVKSALHGGHKLSKFYREIAKLPLQPVADVDLTAQAAPNLDLVRDMLDNVGIPIRDLIEYYARANHPLIARFIAWKYKKRIEKLNHKYFSGERNAKTFAVSKSYRFLLYRKLPAL